ncbi:MAG TPA: diacylglycerol kinase family protein [Acidimicrobiia bacterium]|nr:diacylglycerol kinase family protein [Acidimicrobiia bacterium]
MRVLLIVNAVASAVTPRRRVVIQKALGADHQLEVAETSRRGHAARLARGAAMDGVDVVVVLAGDGTLNEAADGLAGTRTALAPLPGGSTNVFARTLGISRDPVEATAELLESLDAASFRRIGLGSVEGRHFVFHCGIGFDAAVIEQAERRSVLKRFAAPPLFTYAAFETWLRTYDHRRGRFDVAVDGADGDAVRDAIFTIVSNTTPYTFFGSRPVVVAPAAALDAPFELMIMTTRRTTDILRVAASALGSGRFIRHNPGIALRHAAARVRVTGHGPFPYQVDGEYLGEVDELTIAYEPDALTVVTPVDPTRRAPDRERS